MLIYLCCGNIFFSSSFRLQTDRVKISEKMINYDLHHDHLFPQIFVLVPNLFNIKSNCKIIISGEGKAYFEQIYSIKNEIYSYKKRLSRFDIDPDIFIMN